MFTLIKREIEDNIVYFIGALIVSGTSIAIIASRITLGSSNHTISTVPMIMFTVFGFLIPWMSLACASLGATQMYSDRDKKISAFLSTLATTRGKILAAKIITGILWILVVLLPIVIADVILLKIFSKAVPIHTGLLVKIFSITVLTYSICYCIGLQMGWNQNKFLVILGTLVLILIFPSIMIIKGLGVFTAVILPLLVIALIVLTWQKFMSTSL